MKRPLILYASTHHGNTRRLAEAMAEAAGAELCNLLHDPLPDLSGYDLIGMASGIYYGKLHPRIPELLRASLVVLAYVGYGGGMSILMIARGGLLQQIAVSFHDGVQFIDIAVDQVGIGDIVKAGISVLQLASRLL